MAKLNCLKGCARGISKRGFWELKSIMNLIFFFHCYSPSSPSSTHQIINYDSPRGGVSVITLKGDTTTSFLLIKSARSADSGHYQCNPSNSKPKRVFVHVLNGKSLVV